MHEAASAGGPTISTAFLTFIIDRAAQRGADARELRRRAALPGVHATRTPAGLVYRVWELAVDYTGDPALPIEVAQSTRLDGLGLLGFTILTSPNLARALSCAANYYPLLTTSARWSVETRPSELRVVWHRPERLDRGVRISNESAFCQFVSGLRGAVGEPIRPRRIRFKHRAPASRRKLEEFFDARVEFDADEDAIVLSREAGERTCVLANAPLHELVCRLADDALRPLELRSTAARLRHELRQRLASGAPGMADIAHELGTCTRTLHRRLSAEGTSYAGLLDEVRRDEAQARVEHTAASLTEIALELGFSDLSSFSRAYRRWFDASPSSAGRRRRRPSRPC